LNHSSTAAGNPDLADGLVVQRIQHLLNRIRLSNQLAGLGHQQTARVRQLETGTDAHKQFHAEIVFKRFDMMADRRYF